jgi:nucleoside 2-deoxyribosyltransferase
MDRSAAEAELDNRIALGEELLSRGRTPRDPRGLISDAQIWTDTNRQLLRQMFTGSRLPTEHFNATDEPEPAGSPYVNTDVFEARGAILGRLTHLRSVKSQLPHFEPEPPAVPAAMEPAVTVWLPDRFRLFISHVHGHREEASRLKQSLARYHISGFVAHVDIEPTREWENEILETLRTADALVAWLTDDFHASKWTDQEVGFMMGRGRPVVSIQRESAAPYGFIGRHQAVNGHSKTEDQLAGEVFTALASHEDTRRRIAEALVAKLEQSNSYDESIATVDLLERLPWMDNDLRTRAHVSIASNGEVGRAWGVPDRLQRL